METDGSEYIGQSNNCIEESQSAVNNLIIDYYKKFGRKRDLEQFFSLSTAQSEIRDPASLFWRKMKSQTDSSDSAEKKSESSTELCRISIKCSIPEPSTSQDDYQKLKSDSESPPIIREEAALETSRNSDNESIKSEDIYSHKSADGTLDTSTNKPHSPTSSITSQRKLEWDSLADVGYANASDRKNSASSLSTLERMALQQQYSYNDTKQDSNLGMPTAQSTPLDGNESKAKNKKGFSKKTTKFYNRDIDSVNLNISQKAENNGQPINVNLTKHISFNVQKDGGVTIENVLKNVSVSPEKVSVETEVSPPATIDKEIQTSLTKNKQKSRSCSDFKEQHVKKTPVLISLNTLKKKTRKKKVMRIKRQKRRKNLPIEQRIMPIEKSTEQLSEAESFEYMPGHIYNQNQINKNNNDCGNKSSLESSAGLTTDSSKTIKYSFTKDLETGIDILKKALEHRFEDSKLKHKLIKEVVQRLIKTKYRDDDSSTDFLSGLSFDSKKVDLYDNTRTASSTSDANNIATKIKTSNYKEPKKSILRMDKFNANAIASTSQSVPNLPGLSKTEKPIPYTKKTTDFSNTDSDISSKSKNLSDTGIDKTPSEVLYKKYLDALKREEIYKKHLKDKEIFLKQKLVSSDLAFNVLTQAERRKNNLKDLMNDLVRNNYDDGSGDASKLEGGSSTNINYGNNNSLRKQRSHSVFTLSSGNSDNNYTKRSNGNKKAQNIVDNSKDCHHKSARHYCCCPYHTSNPRIEVIDSSVQVDINSKAGVCPDSKATQSSPQENEVSKSRMCHHKCDKCKGQTKTQIVSDCEKEDIKYFCVCTGDEVTQKVPENILIYKCSRLTNKYLNLGDNITAKVSNTASEQFSSNSTSPHLKLSTFGSEDCEKKCLIIKDNISLNNQTSKSSQTNINLPIKLRSKSSEQSFDSSSSGDKNKKFDNLTTMTEPLNSKRSKYMYEATRCIQTEISIDPKISDPSLSDINIINEKNCVEIISENYKEISQPSSKSIIEKQTEIKSSAESNAIYEKDSSKYLCRDFKEKSTNTIDKFDKEIQSSIDNNNQIPVHIDKQSPNNFTIPIQGTNMTLKVSLGSGNDNNVCKNTANNDLKHNPKFACMGTETVKNNIAENYTSLQEECSRGVQSSNANIFDEFYQQTKSTYCENRNTHCENIGIDKQDNTNHSTFPKPCSINTCLTDCCKYNTFPKNDKRNVQKPLLRSNTDNEKIEKSCRVTFTAVNNKNIRDAEVQYNNAPVYQMESKSISTTECEDKTQVNCSEKNSFNSVETKGSKSGSEAEDRTLIKSSDSNTDNDTKSSTSKDPLFDIIQDITRRYSKKDIEKTKRKKCFREIITFLNYLLDTDENTDQERNKTSSSSACENVVSDKFLPKESSQLSSRKTFVDKGIQLSTEKMKPPKTCTNSSESPITTEMPSTSSDSATCKVLNKIKKECEKYHQKRCKSHARENKCEVSSSTSMNCDQCRRIHYCSCKGHKCKNHRAKKSGEKKKKCVAYNLIIQTSESVETEEVTCDNNRRKLQNIIVKVPSKRKVGNMPFKEVATKIEKDLSHFSPRSKNRSKSLPNDSEISSTDEFLRKANAYTVREYLERNRPDFVEQSSNRQHCLKLINETRPSDCDKPRLNMLVVHKPSCTPSPCTEACNRCCKGVPFNNCNPCLDPYMHCVQNEVTRIGESIECAVLNAIERSVKRQLLSLQLDRTHALSGLTETELKNFARVLGHELRRKKVAPKFISEREMKKHSEKIYKSLPEVVHKKEEIKKENIKKTNLLMANIFRKNLQKKTLQGAVNLSNYSTVIKI